MTKRIFEIALSAALVLASFSATGRAEDPRETALVRAVKRAKASVVNIHSEKTTFAGDPLFANRKGRKVNGMGTGIIVDERGYVVTNHHVVNGVDSLRVTLENGSTYDAVVISEDHSRDLAMIKINPTSPLTVMPMGTSSDIMLGETVIAVGNAFGYEHTVTSGIVSALGRDVEVNETQSYKNLIQTDASINPGNSGGPLINLNGDVVGINVAIRAGAQRIGFAIPIDDAREVIAQLLNIEQFDQNYHGLVTRDLKTATTKKLIVSSARANSPAAEAGFKPGDVVEKVADINILDGADFERALLGRSAGEKVNVVVRRNDQTETLAMQLAQFNGRGFANSNANSGVVVRANNDSSSERVWSILGVRLAKVSQGDKSLSGSKYNGGLQVVSVRHGSPAAVSLIRQGDVLVGLDKYETVTPENVTWILDRRTDTPGPLKFHIVRSKETLWGQMNLGSSGIATKPSNSSRN